MQNVNIYRGKCGSSGYIRVNEDGTKACIEAYCGCNDCFYCGACDADKYHFVCGWDEADKLVKEMEEYEKISKINLLAELEKSIACL